MWLWRCAEFNIATSRVIKLSEASCAERDNTQCIVFEHFVRCITSGSLYLSHCDVFTKKSWYVTYDTIVHASIDVLWSLGKIIVVKEGVRRDPVTPELLRNSRSWCISIATVNCACLNDRLEPWKNLCRDLCKSQLPLGKTLRFVDAEIKLGESSVWNARWGEMGHTHTHRHTHTQSNTHTGRQAHTRTHTQTNQQKRLELRKLHEGCDHSPTQELSKNKVDQYP